MPHIGSDGHPQKQIMLLGSHAAGVGWSILCPLERPPTPSPLNPVMIGRQLSPPVQPLYLPNFLFHFLKQNVSSQALFLDTFLSF